jgi:hypothetical protein
MRHILLAAALAASTATLAGCPLLLVGGAAAGGTAVYLNKVDKVVPFPVPVVQDAARKALADLELTAYQDRGDAEVGVLKAKFADDQNLDVDLNAETPRSTKITVRVGIVAQTDRAQRVLDAITNRLPTP